MNQVIEVLKNRRSIRRYKEEPISSEQLEQLKELMVLAPSAMNEQPWYFAFVQNFEKKYELCHLSGSEEAFYGAPLIVLAFYRKAALTPVVDTTFALSNLMNGATALGLGTCFIYNIKGLFDEHEELYSSFNIPEGYVCLGGVCVGVPDEEKEAPERKQDVFIDF